jgi:RNase H-like domain found in reverse transcriptase/Integrase zinc binding domain
MPFGITNAPSVCQALSNDEFREFLDDFVMISLDDIIIYSKLEEEDLQHVETVLQKLKSHTLFGEFSKCLFNGTEVDFLGTVVNAEGIKMKKCKVEGMQKWPRPKNVRDLQSFFGLANYYRRYIEKFSTLSAPLTNAMRGQRKLLDWGKRQESAFHDFKRAYTTAPVLKIADAALDYEVTTDASDVGIGAVLEQEYDDGLHPVGYASRKLNSAEQNYPTHDRELLAIIYAVREWRTYLHGARFRIRCGHYPLQYLETQLQLSRRQIRGVDALAEFGYRIEYYKGKWNILSDVLSRPPDLSTTVLFTGEEDELQATEENIRLNNLSATSFQIDDSVRKSLINDYKSDPAFAEHVAEPKSLFEAREGMLYKDGKLCVPIGKLIQSLTHNSIVAGHLGIDRTIASIKNKFTWDGMSKDIAEYIRSCDRCQRNKPTPSKPI